MKRKNLRQRLLYLARISFRFKGEIKTFTDKQKLTEFSSTKPEMQDRPWRNGSLATLMGGM